MLIICIFSSLLIAKKLSFDPNDYKPIPYEYRELKISPLFDLNGQFTKKKKDVSFNEQDEQKSSDFETNVYLTYKKDLHTLIRDKIFRLQLTPLSIKSQRSYSKIKVNDEEKDSRFRDYVTNFVGNITLRKYNSPDKFFSQFKPQVWINASFNGPIDRGNNIDSKEFENTYNDFNDNVEYTKSFYDNRKHYERAYNKNSLSLSGGFGRKHDITYTAVAIHIITYLDLHKLLLKRSSSTIVELSKELEILKRNRVLDKREALPQHIKNICKWLVSNNISKEIDYVHVMQIADIWNYAFHQRRYKGNRIEVGFSGSNSLSYSYEIEKNVSRIFDTTVSSDHLIDAELIDSLFHDIPEIVQYSHMKSIGQVYRLAPFCNWSYNKSIGMKKHISFSTSIIGIQEIRKPYKEDIRKSKNFQSVLDIEYSIFPSMRSSIDCIATFNYYKWYQKQTGFDYKNSDRWDSTIGFDITYYISPKLSFSTTGDYSVTIRSKKLKDKPRDKSIVGNYSLKSQLTFQLF